MRKCTSTAVVALAFWLSPLSGLRAQGTADLKSPTPPKAAGAVPSPGAPAVPPAVLAPPPGVTPAAAAAPKQSDPQAIAIVESYLKSIGGKDVLAKVKDRATKFRNIKHAATGPTVANINLLIKEGILIREEWDIEGFDIKGEKLAFNQIYNGKVEEGWVQMLGTVSPLDGRTLQVFVWDKQMDDFFCRWKEDGYTLTMGGQGLAPKDIMGTPEDIPCDIVIVTDFSGRQDQRFFFSKKDGLLIKKEWQDVGTNPKASTKKEQYYKEYRDLPFMDGSGLQVKFSLKLEIYLDGDLDTERQYTNVRFNSSLSDKLFDKPEGKAFAPTIGPGGKPIPGTPAPPTAVSGAGEKASEGGGPKAKVKRATGMHPSTDDKKAVDSKASAPPGAVPPAVAPPAPAPVPPVPVPPAGIPPKQ